MQAFRDIFSIGDIISVTGTKKHMDIDDDDDENDDNDDDGQSVLKDKIWFGMLIFVSY